MGTSIRDDIHAETTLLGLSDLVRTLNENLGTTVVQSMTGTKDRGMPARWATPAGPTPRADTQQRLRLGYRVWRTIERSQGPDVALAWLLGANPHLEERSPILEIHALNASSVLSAAEAFVSDNLAA